LREGSKLGPVLEVQGSDKSGKIPKKPLWVSGKNTSSPRRKQISSLPPPLKKQHPGAEASFHHFHNPVWLPSNIPNTKTSIPGNSKKSPEFLEVYGYSQPYTPQTPVAASPEIEGCFEKSLA